MNLRHISLCALLALAPALHAQCGGLGGLGDLVPGGSKADKVLKNAQDGAKIVKGMAGIGIEEERVIGGSVAVEVVSKYGGLVRDQATLRRVNLVGRTLDLAEGRGAKVINTGLTFDYEVASGVRVRERLSYLGGDADTTGLVPADGPRVVHSNRCDRLAGHVGLQPAADHLDFGQLRHEYQCALICRRRPG